MIYFNLQNFAREKWRHEVAKTILGFFLIILEFSFYVQT